MWLCKYSHVPVCAKPKAINNNVLILQQTVITVFFNLWLLYSKCRLWIYKMQSNSFCKTITDWWWKTTIRSVFILSVLMICGHRCNKPNRPSAADHHTPQKTDLTVSVHICKNPNPKLCAHFCLWSHIPAVKEKVRSPSTTSKMISFHNESIVPVEISNISQILSGNNSGMEQL